MASESERLLKQTPAAAESPPQMLMGVNRDALLSTVCYSFCSGTMLVVNKLVAYHIPAPAAIASVQLVIAVLVVMTAHMNGMVEVELPTRARVLPYFYYSLLFAGSLFTNIHALRHSNVETVIVFRSATPVAVAIADFMFLGRELPSARSCAGLAMIISGALAYVNADSQFAMESWTAYHWVMAYFLIIVVEMTYGKMITRCDSVHCISAFFVSQLWPVHTNTSRCERGTC